MVDSEKLVAPKTPGGGVHPLLADVGERFLARERLSSTSLPLPFEPHLSNYIIIKKIYQAFIFPL